MRIVQKGEKTWQEWECFSEGEIIEGSLIPANHAMWGKYANNSTGICIEYDMSIYTDPFSLQRRFMYPIIYRDEVYDATDMFIALSQGDTGSVVGYDVLAHIFKRRSWEWQNEWRLIYGSGFIKDDKPCVSFDSISAVYVGVNTPDSVRKALLCNIDTIGVPIIYMRDTLNGLRCEPAFK